MSGHEVAITSYQMHFIQVLHLHTHATSLKMLRFHVFSFVLHYLSTRAQFEHNTYSYQLSVLNVSSVSRSGPMHCILPCFEDPQEQHMKRYLSQRLLTCQDPLSWSRQWSDSNHSCRYGSKQNILFPLFRLLFLRNCQLLPSAVKRAILWDMDRVCPSNQGRLVGCPFSGFG